MADKTYKTYYLKGLQLLLSDGQGGTMEINFRGGCQIDSTARFSTSDEKVQKLLEKCSGFNRDFYIESVKEIKPVQHDVPNTNPVTIEEPVLDETKEEKQTVQVANKADAIEWLKEHYPEKGYTASKLRTQTALDAACAACNVKFIFNS